MSLGWITINKKLLKASSLINASPTETFTNILHLITEKGEITEDELTKLNETLQYDEDNLQYLIQSILHIYKKSSHIVMKPNALQRDLEEELQLDSDKAEAFIKVWTDITKRDFGDLDKRKKLDEVSWSLYLKTQSSFNPPGTQLLEPTAQLQLNLSDFDHLNCEKTSLELDGQGLKELYKTLESIQDKLDSVNAVKSQSA